MRLRQHLDPDTRVLTDYERALWAEAWLARPDHSARWQPRSTVAAVRRVLEIGRVVTVHAHGRPLPGDEHVLVAWAGSGWVVLSARAEEAAPDLQWVRQRATMAHSCDLVGLPGVHAWLGTGATLDVATAVRLAAELAVGQADPDAWQPVRLPEVTA